MRNMALPALLWTRYVTFSDTFIRFARASPGSGQSVRAAFARLSICASSSVVSPTVSVIRAHFSVFISRSLIALSRLRAGPCVCKGDPVVRLRRRTLETFSQSVNSGYRSGADRRRSRIASACGWLSSRKFCCGAFTESLRSVRKTHPIG